MINPSARTKTALPNIRGTGCTHKEHGIGSSTVPYENLSKHQRGAERYNSLQEGFNNSKGYGFLSIEDETFDNFLKNDNFEDEEEDNDYDTLMQLSNQSDNLRAGGNGVFNFRSLYDNIPKSWMANSNLRTDVSNKGLHRQTKDETRCIAKGDEDNFTLRSRRNSKESVTYGIPRHTNYDNRNSF